MKSKLKYFGSTVVDHSTHKPKTEGSNSAPANWREEKTKTYFYSKKVL